jgi:transposase
MMENLSALTMVVSARAMLDAILAGEGDAAVLADLAQGRLRAKRALLEQALSGRVRAHHRFLLAEHLTQLDDLEAQIGRFDARISAYLDEPSAPPAAAPPQPPPRRPSTRRR